MCEGKLIKARLEKRSSFVQIINEHISAQLGECAAGGHQGGQTVEKCPFCTPGCSTGVFNLA